MIDYRIRLVRSFVDALISTLDRLSLSINQLALAIHQQSDTVREQSKAYQKATEQYKEKSHLPSSVTVELKKPIAVTIQGETKAQVKNPRDWRDNVRLGVELIGLGVLFWYACTTQQLWKESHEQSGHMKTQLELSQRAVLVVGDPGPKASARQVRFPVTNAGFAVGTIRSITINYGVARGNSSTPVLTSHGTNTVPDIEQISHETRTFGFMVNLPKLPDPDAKAIDAGEEIETMQGTLTYDDGFGHDTTVPFCATHDIKLKLWATDECSIGPVISLQ